MRIARLRTDDGPRSVIHTGEAWAGIEDPFAPDLVYTGETYAIEGAELLAPWEPTVVVGISHNKGANDHRLPIQAFLKSSRTVAGPGDEVPYRHGIGTVNMEGELAIVIGTRCSRLAPEDAMDAVFGYSIVNDVTNAGQVHVDEKFSQVKNGTNYTPIGPWIETELHHPGDRDIHMAVNGTEQLVSSTARLPSSLIDVLVYVSARMELGPGDVILTGAPGTSIPVRPGDRVAITIDGIGTLENAVC